MENQPATKKDLKELEDNIREDLKESATKKDLKEVEGRLEGKIGTVATDVAILKHDMTDMKSDMEDMKGTVNKTYNLMDKFVQSQETRDQEFVIVKARVDRVEDKLGLREVPL